MGDPYQLTELDLVNPYLSPLRQWVCTQLAIILPDNTRTIASNDPKTKDFFEIWTGLSQVTLENAWKSEGFTKSDDPRKGAYTRDGNGAVTTSCNGLVGQVISKAAEAGFGKSGARRTPVGTFNLPGCKPERSGKEPATTVGWHWFRDRTASLHPRPGDFFQIGTPIKPGVWQFHHVGVITSYFDGENPTWTTVEAGQGGPGSGFDSIKRKGPRTVKPLDPAKPSKQLMGWLDIDEYFGG